MEGPDIEGYQFGQMVVGGKRHTRDLILLPDRVVTNWWREEGHRLSVEDLREVLVVGTGAYGRMKVPEQTRLALEATGIELQAVRTEEAWRLYNDLRGRQRTAGAFHLTC